MSFNDGFSVKPIPFVQPLAGTASVLISNPAGTGWIAGSIVDNAISASIYVIETVETEGNIEGNGAPEDKVRLKNSISLNSVTASFNGDGNKVTNITASNITNFTRDVRLQLSGTQYLNYDNISGTISLPFTGTIVGTTPLILGETNSTITGLSSISSSQITTSQMNSINVTASIISGTQLASTNIVGSSITGSIISGTQVFSINLTTTTLTGSNITSSQILSTNISAINVTASSVTSSQILSTNITTINLTGSFITGTQLTIDYVDFNTGIAPIPAFKTGRLHYNPTTFDIEYDTDIPNVSVQYGQQTVVKVKNENVQTINKGKLVRIVGGVGANPLIRTASWEDDFNSANTLGMVMETVAPNGFTYVLLNGIITDISLPATTYAAGDILYLSSSGDYTNIKPITPKHTVRLGEVVRAQTNTGVAFVNILNGYELDELHDTLVTSSVLGDLIAYDPAIPAWKNTKTLSGSYTVTGTLSASVLTAVSITGSAIYFSASSPTHWSGSAPTTLQSAIDRLAAAYFAASGAVP